MSAETSLFCSQCLEEADTSPPIQPMHWLQLFFFFFFLILSYFCPIALALGLGKRCKNNISIFHDCERYRTVIPGDISFLVRASRQ